jgi:hypothetical protein
MKIEFRKVTRAGNNVTCQVFFDGIIVAPQLHCTPKEYEELLTTLKKDHEVTSTIEVSSSEA